MKLWRLTRAPYVALDGSGPAQHGGRWTSPGLAVVNFASEPGLAVLVVLRYLLASGTVPSGTVPLEARMAENVGSPRGTVPGVDDYLLGWTETDAIPERIPYDPDPDVKRARGDTWLRSGRTLLAAVTSAVLPEADVIMMNPAHPQAAKLPTLITRPFRFEDCLALPAYDAPTRPVS